MLMRTGGSSFFPTGNILLEQLNADDRLLIGPHLERVRVERGSMLMSAHAAVEMVCFPESVLISVEDSSDEDGHIEVGLVGREGLIGWPVLLGGRDSTHAAVIQMRGGTMLRIGVRDLAEVCQSSPTLLATLLRFVEIITVQMARAIVSNLRDTVERRLSRWLLMRHDRVAGDELQVRHDEISANLGIRRASVTDGLHRLEGERLIRCSRGRITIRDRPLLEHCAGQSYGLAEAHYRALIAPFGRSRARIAA